VPSSSLKTASFLSIKPMMGQLTKED